MRNADYVQLICLRSDSGDVYEQIVHLLHYLREEDGEIYIYIPIH